MATVVVDLFPVLELRGNESYRETWVVFDLPDSVVEAQLTGNGEGLVEVDDTVYPPRDLTSWSSFTFVVTDSDDNAVKGANGSVEVGADPTDGEVTLNLTNTQTEALQLADVLDGRFAVTGSDPNGRRRHVLVGRFQLEPTPSRSTPCFEDVL